MASEANPLTAGDRIRKLRAMSAPELWTRARYTAYCKLERARHTRGAFTGGERLRGALVPRLARSADWRTSLLGARRERAVRFFPGVERIETVRGVLLTRFVAESARAREEAERARRREFSFFGQTFHYPGRVDWNADPVTRAEWPRRYHRDVFVDSGNLGSGDVKYVWELGRHQFLIDLAKGWAIDRDPRYSSALRELVTEWRTENPVATGVGWSCALEPAFRSLSWLWAYFLTEHDPAFDDDSHVQWLEGFYDHGWFLYRHLEYFASPYNHLIGEACALYCLGVLFPEFREAAKWRAHGRRILESRLPAQFYADGGSVEQSTFYHHATTGFYLLATMLGRLNDEEFSPAVRRAVERALEFSMLMQQPDGTTPRIGGADDGKPIRLEQLPLWDFRPYQAVGAVLFERPDFKAAAGRFFEDAFWLLGAEGAAQFDALESRPPAPASRAFESSGYVVLRNRWTNDADYVCFDCGEQAAGLRRDDIPSAAHGHADCLSIIVWRHGKPVLVDAGFHCYNGPKAWEHHFRETAAHNTVRLDGSDQALHLNKMAWSHTYSAVLHGHDVSGGWAVASHDGYLRLERGPVRHRRAIWVRERGYIVVCDFLEGTGAHDVELTFQFAPGALRLAGDSTIFDERVQLHWFGPGRLQPRIHEGGAGPDEGWIAPSLGVKVPAPRLVLATSLEVPARFITVLSDLTSDGLHVSDVSAPLPDRIRIAGSGWAEWLLVNGYSQHGDDGLQSDAQIAAWVETNGRLVADGLVGGTFQRP